MVKDEARIIVSRQQVELATEAVLTNAAVSAILDKKAGREFKKLVARMTKDG